jgi:predicted dienelactone hydrolase
MKRNATRFLLAATICVAALANPAAAADVGIKTIATDAPHRGRSIETLIWYPAAAGGTEESVGDNPLFVGVPARRDAPMAEGRFPLVVVSHGSGGNAANLSWLATALAEQGFIVAAPNHPGTTSGDSRPSDTIKLWERPADLSAVLSGLLADAEMGGRIDARHVGLAGFSLGGYSVLATAGARVDANAYAAYCDTNNEMPDCVWFAKGGVELHRDLDTARVNRSHRDARFSSVVSIDPALAQAYAKESLAAMDIPALVINLGRPGDNVPLGIDAAALLKHLPGAEYRTIADGFHFSFLGVCKPNGKQVLAAEGETDPLCEDGGGRQRPEIHRELASMIAGFFKAKLTN